MSIDLVNIYRQLFRLKPPNYEDGNCMEVVGELYLLTDDKILYDHLFLELEPKRCCIPYYHDESSVIAGRSAGTVEAILFYDKRYKAHYTTKKLYKLILAAFENEMDLKSFIQIIVKNPIEVDSVVDETSCEQYELCWDAFYKTQSDLIPKGKVQFEEGASTSLSQEREGLLEEVELELDEFGYSVQLPEEERWYILREAVEIIDIESVVRDLNLLMENYGIEDKKDIFKLEHDLKKIRRYY
ncbi:hypothetical protein HYG86_07820 [Alkalicella caledoniensis]|uniref:Uncharacterized protein n=1 Tax=Alkalicella caledoniensis TaxID=2731377 RepID=A0A7G9W7N9_ALKCA|nr:hypothetical protein [Alkalicella caledoniensis]QNO14701.1 hypothetical protein HYG86_07820 [Alkalicella caledoniensis]